MLNYTRLHSRSQVVIPDGIIYRLLMMWLSFYHSTRTPAMMTIKISLSIFDLNHDITITFKFMVIVIIFNYTASMNVILHFCIRTVRVVSRISCLRILQSGHSPSILCISIAFTIGWLLYSLLFCGVVNFFNLIFVWLCWIPPLSSSFNLFIYNLNYLFSTSPLMYK
jgi:hypothetical protein